MAGADRPEPGQAPQALADLASALAKLRVPWYLFGAQAAIAYGSPRLTADIDATVAVAPEDLGALVDLLSGDGFAVRVPDLPDFVARTRVVPFTHLASGMPVDIVLAGPGLEEEFLERARPMLLAGSDVPVIQLEDLIATKILAGRPKDLEDIDALLRQRRGSVDLDQVRRLLRLLEQALDRNDLLPALASAAKRAGS